VPQREHHDIKIDICSLAKVNFTFILKGGKITPLSRGKKNKKEYHHGKKESHLSSAKKDGPGKGFWEGRKKKGVSGKKFGPPRRGGGGNKEGDLKSEKSLDFNFLRGRIPPKLKKKEKGGSSPCS